jgi:hypothetical protein
VIAGTGLTGGGSNGNVAIALSMPVSIENGGTGSQTITGALANLGGASLTGAAFTGPVSAPATNLIGNPALFSGATADVQIANCLAAYVTCDASSYGATTQTIAATVAIPANHTLLANAATKFQAGGATVNLFQFEPDSHIDGLTFDCGNQPFGSTAWMGSVFINDPAKPYSADYPTGTANTSIEHVRSNSNCTNVSTGNFFSLTANNIGIYTLSVNHAYVNGLLNGVLMKPSNGGWINGTSWNDLRIKQSIHGVHIIPGTSSVSYGGATANIFTNFSCESHLATGGSGSNTGLDCVLLDGTSTNESINGNAFYGAAWDYATPLKIANTSAQNNYFNGYYVGSISNISDVTGGLYTLVSPFQMQAPSVVGLSSLYAGNPACKGSNCGGTVYLGNTTSSVWSDGYSTVLESNGGPINFMNGSTLLGQIDNSGNFRNGNGTIISAAATNYHGSGAGDVMVQTSDGTGTSGYVAVYDVNGGLTNGTAPLPVSGTISLTVSTSDSASISGVTSSSHCVFSPTNSTATGTTILPYISAMSEGIVTITHVATVGNGATYNIVCTVN